MKIISILICVLFLINIFPELTTAKNLISVDNRIINTNANLKVDLIKITNGYPLCDMDNDFVVYAEIKDSSYLCIYNIKTGETDSVFLGGDIVYPKISENIVVYYDFLYMGFKMYNIDTGKKTDLIITNWPGGESDAFQYFGDFIVYENSNSGEYETEIFLYNIATGENIQLTDSPGEIYTQNPCIYKNIVAWQINEGNLVDIVMYDIDSKKYTRVTNTSQFESETFPSIYDNNIVYNYFYYDKENGTIIYGLNLYNITTGDETTILTGEEPTGSTPEIFGNIIAYSKPSVSLHLYNLRTNYNISIYEGEMLAYPWNLNDNYVLFTIVKEGVYLYKYNNVPDPPTINGPTKVKINTGYDYQFLLAFNLNGDECMLFIDWGDNTNTGWTGPYSSGQIATASHSWEKKGTAIIKAKTKNDFGESNWSLLEITIPRNKITIKTILERFWQNHPYLFTFLQKLLNN